MRLPDEAATARLGAALGPLLARGDVVTLSGALGAGKTALARAMIQAAQQAAGDVAEEVSSPTFTLVLTYQAGALQIAHADLYRIETPDELEELGLEEASEIGALIIEWPDRLGGRDLGATRLDVVLDATDAGGRIAALHGDDHWSGRLDDLAI